MRDVEVVSVGTAAGEGARERRRMESAGVVAVGLAAAGEGYEPPGAEGMVRVGFVVRRDIVG